MDPVEQQIILKNLFLKGVRYKITCRELCSVLGELTDSLLQTRDWIRGFKDTGLSREDEDRSRRPPPDLTDEIRQQLGKFPFMSAKVLAKHLNTLVSAIGRILKTHLGLEKFSRKWVPHELTEDQKRSRCEISRGLLNGLKNDESTPFSHVATEGRPWFS
jgi:hypothetical protein